ncbi:MAG: hypothetical protein C4576_16970 [Desulfobacteraceae bacterium]|nr:MAG: hypothetical protein C4576_16970 [Desulfobacteraceae bacterium]
MEDVIRTLEDKKALYLRQLREIEDQLVRVDQAIAVLRGNDEQAAPTIEPYIAATQEPTIAARTPWP